MAAASCFFFFAYTSAIKGIFFFYITGGSTRKNILNKLISRHDRIGKEEKQTPRCCWFKQDNLYLFCFESDHKEW
jgi:non-ribosomal peptide synthetase component E (peptide arylation enzyme)